MSSFVTSDIFEKNKKAAKKLLGDGVFSSSSDSSAYDQLTPEEKAIYGTPPTGSVIKKKMETLRPEAEKIKKSGLVVSYDPENDRLRQRSPNPSSEARLKRWVKYPMEHIKPKHYPRRVKSPKLEDIKAGTTYVPDEPHYVQKMLASVIRGKKAREERQEIEAMHPIQGGRKTRKKSKRFRNNLRKNKISRKYIMLKQCGGSKAKMGAKSKPYSSKRKAMKSRRRVCYYKKKGRTLKLKKKKKSRGRKKSRRRRR
jgi:hypothetical protein